MLDFLKRCHRLAPFLFFNGNTFAAIGRQLAVALFSELPTARQREVASAIAHCIAGVLDRESMVEIVESLSQSTELKPGDRVKTLRGSMRGVIRRVLPDGRVACLPDDGGLELIALPESLMRDKSVPSRIQTIPMRILSVTILMLAVRMVAFGQTQTVRFTEFLISKDYDYAYGIAVGDLDGDGSLDITSADATGNNLYWFENDGKGNFRRHFVQQNESGWFERHAIADLNGDGKPDVVTVKNLTGEVVWFENNGTPKDDKPWKRHVIANGTLPGAYDVAVADFDGDGDLDVAASSWLKGNKFVWYENPGKTDKPWTEHVIDENMAETRTIRVADFNGDGKPDLLGTASTAGQVVWYENLGRSAAVQWKKHVIDTAGRPIHGQPVDMDGDGDIDVVMALGFGAQEVVAHQIVWYENVGKPGKGTEWKKHIIADNFPQAFEVAAADLDGDGDIDVVATAEVGGAIVWFENPGDPKGKWTPHVLKASWSKANSVIIADLNKDGRPDIVATAERGANELRWWRNDGRK